MRKLLPLAALCLFLSPSSYLLASAGTEGAAFLKIPVGAEPAALGSAYSALATDAYAPVWNPAGLGLLTSPQLAGQHLFYLESIRYEFASFVLPIANQGALGVSAQYLTSGDITGTDNSGNLTGSYSTHYGAYSLAYGRAFSDHLSLGLTGKLINAAISDVSANAFAADLGSLYKASNRLTLAATVVNMGSKLKFLNDGDSLPLAGRLGAAFLANNHWLFSTEGEYRQNGMGGFHVGTEWRPIEMLRLRAGYRTDTLKGLSALAGFSTGLGIYMWGTEFSYAFLPYGDLGNTQYFSLRVKFGAKDEERKNLIQYQDIKRHRSVRAHYSSEKQKTVSDTDGKRWEPVSVSPADEIPEIEQLLREFDAKENNVAASPTPSPEFEIHSGVEAQ